jgi:hypothetical protein
MSYMNSLKLRGPGVVHALGVSMESRILGLGLLCVFHTLIRQILAHNSEQNMCVCIYIYIYITQKGSDPVRNQTVV